MIRDDALKLEGELHGYCPVQGWGTVADHRFYFRARHGAWTFSVALDPTIDPVDVDASGNGFFLEQP